MTAEFRSHQAEIKNELNEMQSKLEVLTTDNDIEECVSDREDKLMGSLGDAEVWRLPLAQGEILETRDPIPRRAPGVWSLLLPLPVSLPPSLSLCVCNYHK